MQPTVVPPLLESVSSLVCLEYTHSLFYLWHGLVVGVHKQQLVDSQVVIIVQLLQFSTSFVNLSHTGYVLILNVIAQCLWQFRMKYHGWHIIVCLVLNGSALTQCCIVSICTTSKTVCEKKIIFPHILSNKSCIQGSWNMVVLCKSSTKMWHILKKHLLRKFLKTWTSH